MLISIMSTSVLVHKRDELGALKMDLLTNFGTAVNQASEILAFWVRF